MRIDYIDGIRGFLAFMIVCIHHMVTFFMFVPFGVTQSASVVCGFFLISGFVLSYRFWQNKKSEPLTVAAIRRYVRLTGPAFIAIMVQYLLMKYNTIHFHFMICCTLTLMPRTAWKGI